MGHLIVSAFCFILGLSTPVALLIAMRIEEKKNRNKCDEEGDVFDGIFNKIPQ